MWEQRHGFPDAAADCRRLSPLHAGGRRDAAPRAGLPRRAACRSAAAIERARETGGAVGPALALRRGRGRRARRAPAGPAQGDARGAEPRDRARDARARGRAGAVRRLPARALLPADRAALAAHGRPRRRGRRVRRLPRRAAPARRPGRDADRPRRRARQRVGGRSSTRPGSPRACSPGSSPGATAPGARTTATGASRRSGRSTPRAARRACPHGGADGRARSTPRWASASTRCSPTGRSRSTSPRPR